MKKTAALPSMVVLALILAAFSIGFTQAYLTDRDTAAGARVSAEYLEVSVKLALSGYGIPGDTLLTSNGSGDMPDKSTVTVKNEGLIALNYKLSLTIDKETEKLLDTDGFLLIDDDGVQLQFSGNPIVHPDGNVTYVYESTKALEKDDFDTFGIELTFKGETLLDGNDFQNKTISVTPAVEAFQVGGVEQ